MINENDNSDEVVMNSVMTDCLMKDKQMRWHRISFQRAVHHVIFLFLSELMIKLIMKCHDLSFFKPYGCARACLCSMLSTRLSVRVHACA